MSSPKNSIYLQDSQIAFRRLNALLAEADQAVQNFQQLMIQAVRAYGAEFVRQSRTKNNPKPLIETERDGNIVRMTVRLNHIDA